VLVLLLALVTGGAAALRATDVFRWEDTARPEAVPAQTSDPGQAPDLDGTEQAPEPSPTATPEPPPPPPDVVLTLVAAGDVLLHQPVINSAAVSDGYDFRPLFAPMDPWVQGADLALCHLEVPVAPPGTAPSGYPVFGAPVEIAEGLRAAGWDGCSTASNHSVDRGWAGLVATLDALDGAGLGHVGTARSETEAAAPQLYDVEREGGTVRIAHLSTTYGTNGIPLPADAPWSVETPIDTDALIEQSTAARDDGADLVVISVHCCVEYVSQATDEQQRIARAFADSGVVDLVIGHHAHVPQPIELLEGGPRDEGMWVAHGLGNYISNQDANCCSARTDSGLLMTATIRRPADGPAAVTGVEWTAVTVDRAGGHRVHPMPSPTVEEGAGTFDGSALRTRWGRVAEVVGSDAPERVAPPEPTGPEPVVLPRPRG
jgi:poly-gamma-glutamate capsule biosynthesis protein CapA/YwtB (metallophosphatase superfamily)